MKYNISKELFKVVMGVDVHNFVLDEFGVQYDNYGAYILYNDFFFKCKKWALDQEYEVFSSGIECSIYEIGNGWIVDQIKSDSEQQAVFSACMLLLENKDK